MFWIGLLCGIFIGAMLGIAALAIVQAGEAYDDYMPELPASWKPRTGDARGVLGEK